VFTYLAQNQTIITCSHIWHKTKLYCLRMLSKRERNSAFAEQGCERRSTQKRTWVFT